MIYWIMWTIIAGYTSLFMPTRVIGKKYLKMIKKDSAILAYNHQSNFDGILIKTKISPTSKLMAKDSLFKNKIGNWFFRTVGAFPVNRGGNDIEAVKMSLKYLKDGNKLAIAPEGTRVKEGESVELKNGVVMFAIKTNSYIVPIFFRKKPKNFVYNTLLIGKPFKYSEIEGFDGKLDKDLKDRATQILGEKLEYLKNVNIKEYKKQIKKDIRELKNIKK